MQNAKKLWIEYLSWIITDDTDIVFRGHSSKDFKLIPSVGRDTQYTFEKELQLFEHFKNQGRQYIQCNSDLEWLASAQHHGLPTRLLDWTYNPLVALYFAIKDDPEIDGVIYHCKATKFLSDNKNLFESNNISFYLPPSIDVRIKNQRSIFSIHGKPNQDYSILLNRLLPSESFVAKTEMKERHQFIIPSKYKKEILNYLNIVNINSESIFGGIDGLAEKLKFYGSNNLLPLIDYKISKQNLMYRIEELQNKIGEYLSSRTLDTVFSKFNDDLIILTSINTDIQNVVEKNEYDETKILETVIKCNFIYSQYFQKSHNSPLWAISKDEYYAKFFKRDQDENNGLIILFEKFADDYYTPIIKASRYSRNIEVKCNISIDRRSGNLSIRDIVENKDGAFSYYQLKLPTPNYYVIYDDLIDSSDGLSEAIYDFWEGEKYNEYYTECEEEYNQDYSDEYQRPSIEERVSTKISEEIYEEDTIERFVEYNENEIKEASNKISLFYKNLKEKIDESVLSKILHDISLSEDVEGTLKKFEIESTLIEELLESD